jgi:hypothetical protein
MVIFQPIYFRCGYVGVEKGHPLYKKNYGQINASVHGGLTFSGWLDESKTWWFGFDCGHYGDGYDFDKAREYGYIDEVSQKRFKKIQGDFWTKEQVERECKNLAEQL